MLLQWKIVIYQTDTEQDSDFSFAGLLHELIVVAWAGCWAKKVAHMRVYQLFIH